MQFVATTTVGAEPVLAEELEELGAVDVKVDRGAVLFEGSLELGLRACLWSRIASRVLLVLGHSGARDAEALYRGARRIPWADHLAPSGSLAVDFVGTNKEIRNSRFGSMRVKDAIVDTLRDKRGTRPSVDLKDPDVRVRCRLVGNKATLMLDLSGAPLFKRGLDRDGGPAPLKETLAAAILRIAGWHQAAAEGAPLYDPMCGSGTFLVEAAGIAAGLAPGLTRASWGFSRWLGHDSTVWDGLLDEARNLSPRQIPPIYGSDIEREQVARAERNLERACFDGIVRLERQSLAKAKPPVDTPGLLVTNPPYGERLGAGGVGDTYRLLGDVMRRRFLGWTGWVLAGSPALARQFGLKPARKVPLWNGRIECRLVELPISRKPVAREQ